MYLENDPCWSKSIVAVFRLFSRVEQTWRLSTITQRGADSAKSWINVIFCLRYRPYYKETSDQLIVYQPESISELYPEASRTENSQTETLQSDHVYDRSYRAGAGPVTEGATIALSLNT